MNTKNLTRKQLDALKKVREEVLENGKAVGWNCWSHAAAGRLEKMFVPA